MKKNKLPLIALMFSFLLGVFGGTIAYYSGSAKFTNEFQAAKFKTKTTENFTSPTNWRAGEEIPSTIVTTNEGTIPVAVRASYTEKWEDSSGNPLNITDAVTINFDNAGKWNKVGNYFYYKYILNPGKSTKSFIKSVTLNEEVGDVTCTSSSNGLEQVCETTGDAAGKKYTLLINIETVDIEQYQDAWNTNIEIVEYVNPIQFVNRQTEGEITVGDLVKIGDTEEFYVVSSDEDDTVLLARYNLLVGRTYTSSSEYEEIDSDTDGYGLQNENAKGRIYTGYPFIGTIAFSNSNYWNNQVGDGLTYPGGYDLDEGNYPYVYDSNSNLFDILNDYKIILENENAEIETIRLLSYQEAYSLGCQNASCQSAPEWLSDSSYWLGSAMDTSGTVWMINSDAFFGGVENDSKRSNGVRPVIVIATSDLD